MFTTMGYGTTQPSNRVYAKLLGMKKGSDKLYFEITKNKEVIAEATFIEGIIINIELGTYTYEEKERETYILTLRDGKEEIQLGISWNAVSRSILNVLAGDKVDFSKPIKINVYQKSVNGKVYNQVSLRQDGQMLKWKYSFEEQKQYSKPIFVDDEYIKTDHKQWDALLKKEIEAMLPKLPKIDTTQTGPTVDEVLGGEGQDDEPTEKPTPTKKKSKKEEVVITPADGDDLPF